MKSPKVLQGSKATKHRQGKIWLVSYTILFRVSLSHHHLGHLIKCQKTCSGVRENTLWGHLTLVTQIFMCSKWLTLCVFLQTECGRTATQQLTTREATLKRWIVEGGLHLATIPQGIQARAVAHSPPGMEPLSCKLHLKRSTSGQVFAQFTWLSLESSPGGSHGQMLLGSPQIQWKTNFRNRVHFGSPNDQEHVRRWLPSIVPGIYWEGVTPKWFSKGSTVKVHCG